MKFHMNFVLSVLLALSVTGTPLAVPKHSNNRRTTSTKPTQPTPTDTTWNPPANLAAPLAQVWKHEVDTYSDALGFKNYGYDQLIATNGTLNYCVRWESNEAVTETDRTATEVALQRSVKKWMDWLVGFDDFPLKDIKVQVVGWAVKDTQLLKGDTSGIQVYTDKDPDGVPECSQTCGRFFHQDSRYSSCQHGAARHYDQSLWLTEGMNGGAGGDWGQRIGRKYFMQLLDAENIHILLHEMGHTFGLDDFYDWMPDGVTNFIMNAGSSTVVTDFDGWMLRDWWRHLKSRYNL